MTVFQEKSGGRGGRGGRGAKFAKCFEIAEYLFSTRIF